MSDDMLAFFLCPLPYQPGIQVPAIYHEGHE